MSSLWNQYDELRKEIEVKIEVVKNAKKGSKQQHWSWHLYLWPCYQVSFFCNLKYAIFALQLLLSTT